MNTKKTLRKENELVQLLKRSIDPSISEIKITPLAGDASNRTYFRVSYSAPSTGSVIAMILNKTDKAIVSEEITNISQSFTELPFINILRHLEKTGVGLPKLYYYSEKEGLLLLEDLGDDLLVNLAQGASEEDKRQLYEKAVDTLIILQEKGSKNGEDCYAFRQTFSYDLFLWEFNHFLEYAIEKKHGSIPSKDRKTIEGYFSDISMRLSSEPRVFTHRDYHGWNLIVKNKEIKILDFQDALMGPRHYDLASLLLDRSTPEILGAPLVQKLISYYCQKSRLNISDFQEIFDLAGVQRCLKAAGRFEYIFQVKGNPAYRKYIPGTLKLVASILYQHKDLHGLLELLRKYAVEMKE